MLKAEIIWKLTDEILLLVKTIVSKPRIKYEKILSIMKIHQCKKGEEQSPQRPKLCIHSSKSLLSLSWPLHYNFWSLVDMEPLTKCIDVKLLQRWMFLHNLLIVMCEELFTSKQSVFVWFLHSEAAYVLWNQLYFLPILCMLVQISYMSKSSKFNTFSENLTWFVLTHL